MAVAVADYDNDSDPDLFRAGVDRNLMYRNEGDGTFADMTAEAGLSGVDRLLGKLWSVSAGWFDYDSDGHLDLFVTNHLFWDPRTESQCGTAEHLLYCHPDNYWGQPNQLYRNRGDGTLEDVSRKAGIFSHVGKGMGVASGDFDRNTFPDVFVGNDSVRGFLFFKRGDGTFAERGLVFGVALREDGVAIAGMGADFRDYDEDGRPDIFVAGMINDTFLLFRIAGAELPIDDFTMLSQIALHTHQKTGWGVGVYDFDNDGHKDMFSANSHFPQLGRYLNTPAPQANSVFRNDGQGRFEDFSETAGLRRAAYHRGAAFGDFDADGRVNAIVTALNDATLFLRNASRSSNHWLGVRLTGRRSNRDGLGASVRLFLPDGRTLHNHATTAVGYASSSERIGRSGMVTKTGTNDFHSTSYWFHRNDKLNANSFFANRAGRDRPTFDRNQFGGVVGGPIKENRTLFLGTFEHTGEERPLIDSGSTMPTLLQRTGAFSDTFTSSGEPVQIFNPFDNYTTADGTLLRRPFANRMVPAAMHNPIALNALQYFPEPNQEGSQYTNRVNFFAQGIDARTILKYDMKVDHLFNDKDRMMARYTRQRNKGNPDNLFGEGNPAHTYNRGPTNWSVHQGVFEWNRTHSPTTMTSIRYGVLRGTSNRDPFEEFKPSDLGLPTLLDEHASALAFPEFAPEGYQNVGVQGWQFIGRAEDVNQINGFVSKVAGGHNIRIGGEFRHLRLDSLQPGYPAGRFTFNRRVTRENRFQGSGAQRNGLASMLVGWGAGSSCHIDPWSVSRSQCYGGYIQDDWKITPQLAINLGLRYDLDRPRWERDNPCSYWNLDDPHPINDQVPV